MTPSGSHSSRHDETAPDGRLPSGRKSDFGPWLARLARYAIAAKVPVGSTRDQLLVMLQDLLAERFHLALHHEMKDFPAYELVIAKGGSKLKPAAEAAPAASPPNPPPGRYFAASPEPGVSRLKFNTVSISDLATALSLPLGTMGGNMLTAAHIVDKTGLTGKHVLPWSSLAIWGQAARLRR